MSKKEILVAEISGKRPGGSDKRCTEQFRIDYDKVIISNNSDGYITDWNTINVPDDYRDWYIANLKNSENAWYAPMNRSYAIKYARERGYKYLIQLDDNIQYIEIAYFLEKQGKKYRYRLPYQEKNTSELMNDYIDLLVTVLKNTNAVMSGCNLMGTARLEPGFMREGYVYSLFALDLDNCPDFFHGDFEDDIEYRLKCRQMGKPTVQIIPLRYGKTGQKSSKDLTGCRAEYAKQGLKRGEHMAVLYSGDYSARMTRKAHSTRAKLENEEINFKHDLKTWKLGVIVYDIEPIKNKFNLMLKKYKKKMSDHVITRTKKVKVKKSERR
jgi:hypothetical protein